MKLFSSFKKMGQKVLRQYFSYCHATTISEVCKLGLWLLKNVNVNDSRLKILIEVAFFKHDEKEHTIELSCCFWLVFFFIAY